MPVAACPICGNIVCSCYEPYCEHCGEIGCRGSCLNPEGPENPDEPPGGGETNYVELDLIVDGAGVVTGAGTYSEGANVRITALANPNNIFGGWSEGGKLFSELSSHTFTIQNSRCLTANFYQDGDECANLFKNYKRNTNLFATVNKHAELLYTNNQIEHAVLRTNDSTYKSFTGRREGVYIKLSLNDIYECIIHNHPSGGLIPSIEDIYTIYIADSASLLAANASFLIQTERGTLSIEVENSSVFRSFASEVLRYSETRDQFKEDFNKFVLGKPSDEELLTDTIRDKAVKYYTQVGLKFAYTNSNGNSADWAYLKIENSAIVVKNCLN